MAEKLTVKQGRILTGPGGLTKHKPKFNIINGRLYNGLVVNSPNELAPEGWHIPTHLEFETLIQTLNIPILNTYPDYNEYDLNTLMKEGYDFWNPTNIYSIIKNSAKFNLKGSGRFLINNPNYVFEGIKNTAILGCIDNADGYLNYNYGLLCDNYGIGLIEKTVFNKLSGVSIRCVKNDSINTGSMQDIDGNIYPTIKIGNQVWMTENLATTKYRNGLSIPVNRLTNGEYEIHLPYGENELNVKSNNNIIENVENVILTSTPLTLSNGQIILSLDKSIVNLTKDDIFIFSENTLLTYSTHYTVNNDITENQAKIDFKFSSYVQANKNIKVIITKSGYKINNYLPLTIVNNIIAD